MAEEEKSSKLVTIASVVAVVLVVLFALAKFTPKPTTEEIKYGVKIVSEFPLEEMKYRQYLALSNDTNMAPELTCKFELSGTSTLDPQGYRVDIEEGDYGVYLGVKEAKIKGKTNQEILNACHAFACLKDNINCDVFQNIDEFFNNAKSMSIILDESVADAGGRGYAEIVGALSYLQTKRVDLDKNGVVEQSEVDVNEFFIYPFTMKDGICTPQPYNTIIQNWSRRNETVDCGKIAPAIFMKYSNETQLKVYGSRLVLEGGDEQLHTEAIIVRDIIAPEWIRRIYGYN
ncbi:MAG: hypothetical protein KKD39_04835 [Candidatus Altiarchaeota archaeon]|nr:hypothetical protein [Candidatus Altiarchaeota archaeon]